MVIQHSETSGGVKREKRGIAPMLAGGQSSGVDER